MPNPHRDCDYPDTPTPKEAEGIAWWNAMTPPERRAAIDQAEQALRRSASIADAWIIHVSLN